MLYIILTRISRGSWISNEKFEIQPVAPTIAILVFQPHLGKIWPWPIEMIYISSGLNFQGDSRSELRNLKFHQWHWLWSYWCFSTSKILENYDPYQSLWSIHHQDLIFKGILNFNSKIWNFISGTLHAYVGVSDIFQESVIFTNQDDLYTIRI
jgi:hypothetical protein